MIVTPWLIIAQEKHELVLQVYELSQKKKKKRLRFDALSIRALIENEHMLHMLLVM